MQLTREKMYVFYQVADVHACAIRLFNDIPLKGNDRYFEGFWIYSLSTPTKIVKQCQTLSAILESKPSKTMELDGMGMLNNTRKCLIYGPNFKLLPHTSGRTRVSIQMHKLVLPANPKCYNE